jgi:hypothetical protein
MPTDVVFGIRHVPQTLFGDRVPGKEQADRSSIASATAGHESGSRDSKSILAKRAFSCSFRSMTSAGGARIVPFSH